MAVTDSLFYDPTRTSETNPGNEEEEEEGNPPFAKRSNEEGGRQSAAKKSKANVPATNFEADVSVPMEKEEKKEKKEEDEDDDVWETESFAEWSDLNWSLFDYNFSDESTEDLPSYIFKIEVYSHAGKSGILKPGYEFMQTVDSGSRGSKDFVEICKDVAAVAIDFYNERHKERGKQLRFEKMVSYINVCNCGPGTLIFFVSFEATDNKGEKKIFQACMLACDVDVSKIRGFREKPR